MEILIANIDLILVALVILICAVVFARRGQIELIRELVFDLANTADGAELYQRLPKLTKMLISSKTVERIVTKTEDA